jgi:hypothetical protein
MMLDRKRAKALPGGSSYRSLDGLEATCSFRCAVMVHRKEAVVCEVDGGEQETRGADEALQMSAC